MSELGDEVESALRARRGVDGGWASSDAARVVMRGNVRKGTRPEMEVRRLVHRAGLRYRVDVAPLVSDRRRRADIVFTRRRIAVFIDGCFWHGCPEHFVEPKANADYWGPKIARNRERDIDTTSRLRGEGWRVMRFWEHEAPAEVAAQIIAAVRGPEPG